MELFEKLSSRANSKCELCSEKKSLSLYEIPPVEIVDENTALILCQICRDQIENPNMIDPMHWRCLNESMWSEFQSVQVMAYRLLKQLKGEAWARELLDQLYLDAPVLKWALAGLPIDDDLDTSVPTFDNNGTKLADGDSVTLIKDLDVKGAGFTAKRGTLVKNISLTSNPKHIEGKVNGVQIVLVAAYLKKA